MNKWFLRGIALVFILIGCYKLFTVEFEQPMILDGTVLLLDEKTTLISLRLDLTEEDLNKTYDEWMGGNYNLLVVNSLSSGKVGDQVRLTLDGPILETYPAQATVKKYKILKEISASIMNETQTVLEDSTSTYNQELLDIFPQTVGLIQSYHGYSEYGYSQQLVDAKDIPDGYFLNFNGEIIDGMGELDSRLFELNYKIDHQSITESVMNYDSYNPLKEENLLHSIIPEKVILKLPLEVGNEWIENLTYKNKDYVAKTTLTRIDLNFEGQKEYETITVIEGIEYGEELGIYKETRVFTEGSGMTSFNNLFSTQLTKDEMISTDDLLMFGFRLDSEKIME